MIYECPDEEAHAKCYRALMTVVDVNKENILPQDSQISSLKITILLEIKRE